DLIIERKCDAFVEVFQWYAHIIPLRVRCSEVEAITVNVILPIYGKRKRHIDRGKVVSIVEHHDLTAISTADGIAHEAAIGIAHGKYREVALVRYPGGIRAL